MYSCRCIWYTYIITYTEYININLSTHIIIMVIITMHVYIIRIDIISVNDYRIILESIIAVQCSSNHNSIQHINVLSIYKQYFTKYSRSCKLQLNVRCA